MAQRWGKQQVQHRWGDIGRDLSFLRKIRHPEVKGTPGKGLVTAQVKRG